MGRRMGMGRRGRRRGRSRANWSMMWGEAWGMRGGGWTVRTSPPPSSDRHKPPHASHADPHGGRRRPTPSRHRTAARAETRGPPLHLIDPHDSDSFYARPRSGRRRKQPSSSSSSSPKIARAKSDTSIKTLLPSSPQPQYPDTRPNSPTPPRHVSLNHASERGDGKETS
mmetsp:Transcript_24802/g.53639  ORF Transcript_24802/g.53639 Transcript_24802/m.53639 type:complete len:169 (+) Transcript_24802:1-507(+)